MGFGELWPTLLLLLLLFLRAGVQPTPDAYAGVFTLLWQAYCANPGVEESGWWCVRLCAWLKGEKGLSRREQLVTSVSAWPTAWLRLDWLTSVIQRQSVRPSIHKVFFPISMKFGLQIEVDKWCMTVCRMTRSKVNIKVTGRLKFRRLHFSESVSCAIYNGSWQITIDS